MQLQGISPAETTAPLCCLWRTSVRAHLVRVATITNVTLRAMDHTPTLTVLMAVMRVLKRVVSKSVDDVLPVGATKHFKLDTVTVAVPVFHIVQTKGRRCDM